MDGGAFDGTRSFQQESGIELSFGGVIGGGISCPEINGGYFDDLVCNGVFDSQDPRGRINLSRFSQLVEGLANDTKRVAGKD